MNLFLAGWNLPEPWRPAWVAALASMTDLYPQLDAGALWQLAAQPGARPEGLAGQGPFLAAIHSPAAALGPRRYIAQQAGQALLYSGFPVQPTGAFPAFQADSLLAHWDELADTIEGQFVLVRAGQDPPRLDVVTDFIGMEQIYVARREDRWLISNSVQLIERILGPGPLDPLGTSLFLGIGWVGADRTLRQDVRVIPGGQHWTWRDAGREPERRSTFPLASLAGPGGHSPDQAAMQRLAETLTGLCRSAVQPFDHVECPITAGRDARLLVGLLRAAGQPARYYTSGNPDSADVRTGRQIAELYGLPHRVDAISSPDVLEKWDSLARRYVQRYDGMSSLWQMADVLTMPDSVERLSLTLWGAGGEIARGFYYQPELFLAVRDLAGIQAYLVNKLLGRRGRLMTGEAKALVAGYLKDFAAQQMRQGFRPQDVPDLFYTFQRVGRWAGHNARKTAPVCDHFTPYGSRAWLRATFALSPIQRYSEPLHYHLIRLLAPELHGLPFDKGAWHRQQPLLNLLELAAESWSIALRGRLRDLAPATLLGHRRQRAAAGKTVKMLDHSSWLEGRREEIRQVCLDRPTSPLWDYVDKMEFERLMAPATPPAERSRQSDILLVVATLFY